MKNEKFEINKNYSMKQLVKILENFSGSGVFIADGRNKIKKFPLSDGKEVNVKKFKKKDFFTELYYRKIKGSKARRSFEYGNRLLENGISTPEPIAYFDEFGDEKASYYISEELKYDFTCREVLWNEKMKDGLEELVIPHRDEIIRQFAGFTFRLHEKGVKFDDYSPGNVLIKRNNGKYEFYLVDLNRMSFNSGLSFSERMKNVSRMMEEEKFAQKFSAEYAKLYGKSAKEVFNKLYFYIRKHKFYVFLKDSTRNWRYFFKKTGN